MIEDNYLYVRGVIGGEEIVEIVQRNRGMIIEISVLPKTGTDISETADIKDNKLNIRLTVDSMIGLFQLLGIVILPERKPRKKIFGIF